MIYLAAEGKHRPHLADALLDPVYCGEPEPVAGWVNVTAAVVQGQFKNVCGKCRYVRWQRRKQAEWEAAAPKRGMKAGGH